MFKQLAALALVAASASPAFASSADVQWESDRIGNYCALTWVKDGELGINADLNLDSEATGGSPAQIRSAVIGNATLKVTDHTATRNGVDILAGHHESFIRYNNGQPDRIYQNTLNQLANQRGFQLAPGNTTWTDLNISSNANKAQDQSVVPGTYVLGATVTCFTN